MRMSGVAERLYDAYNRHDPAAVAQLYAAGATHEDIAQGRPRTGPEAISDGLRKFFGWFPDVRWEPHLQITDPDGRVAVTYLLTATLQAQMGPVPASGQKISLRGVHVLHLQGGLIRRSEDYWDATTFQRQLNNV
jgi:steroid delta-isomerase-like uncharacterized protein